MSEKNTENTAGQAAIPAYDPDAWTRADRLTAGALKEFLGRFPDDARVCCCGAGTVFLHWCPGTSTLSVDCEGLDELPEYDGRSPARLEGAEA